jgi:hypothetical protein
MTPAAGELAFALRLTPNGLETMNFAAGPRLEPVHTQSRPGSDSGSPATSSLLRAVTSETPAPEFPALKEPIADSAQFRVETPPNPFQASPNLFQNDERSPSASPGAQLKSAPRVVAAVGSLDSLAHQPQAEAKSNNTLRVIPPSLPRPNPAVESGISQSQPNGSKPEPAAKPELPETHLNGGRVEGSSAQAVPGWPSDAAGAPDTRVGPPAVSKLPALKVAPEPEIKAAIAPPPTRQISLKLRTDDSTRVNVDVTERAGKVLVAVRTSDHELAQSLQTDLGDLVGRLETKGFKTEAWMPAVALPAAAPSPSSNANPNFAQPQNSNPGNGSGQRRQGQNGPDQRPKTRWAAQLQETMSAKQARSESE